MEKEPLTGGLLSLRDRAEQTTAMTTTNPRMAILRNFSVLAAILLMLSGCERIECGTYRPYVADIKKNAEIEEWADKLFFAKSVDKNDITGSGLVGPGRWALSARSSAEYEFPALSSREIRLIGKDPENPDAVFLGLSAFKGLIVARNDIVGVLPSQSILPDEVLGIRGRTALVCRPYR